MRVFTALFAVAALVLAGCGDDGNGGAGGNTKSEIKLYNDKGAWTPFFEQMGKLSKDQIGVDMKPVGYTDANQYDAFIKASFRTNVKPDLFTWHTGGRLKEIVDAGHVAETTDIWNKAVSNGDVPEELKQYYTINGKQYCVPMNVAYWVMFYNKKVFDANGLQPPKSFDDLMSTAAALKGKGIIPFYHTSVLFSFVWFQQLLVATDPDLYNKLSTGDAKYTDPGVVAVMERWKSMIDSGFFSSPGSKDDPAVQLKSGKVAMANMGTWFNTSMTQQGMKAGEDYGTFVIPAITPGLTKTPLIFESGPLCSLDKAPARETSLKYMQWWTEAPAQEKWANSRGDVSANPKVKIPEQSLNTLNSEAGTGKYQLMNRYFEATPPPILTAALDAFGAFVVKPADYRKQLQNLQKAADDYWKTQGK